LGNEGTNDYSACLLTEIGVRFFPTRAEAEKALKEMEGENEIN
jgi:hypothetical protein